MRPKKGTGVEVVSFDLETIGRVHRPSTSLYECKLSVDSLCPFLVVVSR